MAKEKPTTFEYKPENYVSIERKVYDALKGPSKTLGKFMKHLGVGLYAGFSTPLRVSTTIRRKLNKQTLFDKENSATYYHTHIFKKITPFAIGVALGLASHYAYNTEPEFKEFIVENIGNISYLKTLMITNALSLAGEVGRLKQSILEHRVIKKLGKKSK